MQEWAGRRGNADDSAAGRSLPSIYLSVRRPITHLPAGSCSADDGGYDVDDCISYITWSAFP